MDKPAKIKRSTLIAPIQEGGLNMVDVFAVHTTAKCGWIKRSLLGAQNPTWKTIMYTMLNISAVMLNRNIGYTKFTKCKSKFHEQIMTSWNSIHNISPAKTIEILNQNILYNQLVKINNKHVTELYIGIKNDKTIVSSIKINDIIDNNGKLLNQQFNIKFGLQISRWNWMALISAIPKIKSPMKSSFTNSWTS